MQSYFIALNYCANITYIKLICIPLRPVQNTGFNTKSFTFNQSNVTYEFIWEMIYSDHMYTSKVKFQKEKKYIPVHTQKIKDVIEWPHVILFWASLISNNSKESTKLLWNISCCLLSNPTLRRLLHTILYENHFFRASCSNIKNGNGLLCHCPKSNGPFPSYATVGGRDSKNSPIFYYDNSCLLAKVTLWF